MINPVWSERHRPKTVGDVILPPAIKSIFQKMVDNKEIPVNLLLTGTSGVGKTTVAMATLEELGLDYMVINGSLEGNIDTLRNRITSFASAVSFFGGRKYVLLDEADYLTHATQAALRNFMEEHSAGCGFILTCNFRTKIIAPLQSRCSVIDFKIPKDSLAKLAGEFLKRVCNILDTEAVAYNDKRVISEVIKKYFPDWRRVLNELQSYSLKNNVIDDGILARNNNHNMAVLIDMMRKKKFSEARKWIGENSDLEPEDLFEQFYTTAYDWLTPDSVPQLAILLGEYQYKSALVANQEINTGAFLAHAMATLTFKD